MSMKARDEHTGYLTTGHEWNGITELNTPVPKAVYIFLALTTAFAVLWWVLMPAWPTGGSYTKGLLGADERKVVVASLKDAEAEKAWWTKRVTSDSFEAIASNDRLMQIVRETGPRLFGDNCAACHGREARGNNGFPNLTTNSWLWGGSPEAIAETIRVGINSTHPESHASQMPAFGRDKLLPATDIDMVVGYVRSLSGAPASQTTIESGGKIFADNCAACHGSDAKGNSDLGVPNLTDQFWIYGGDPDSVHSSIWYGRQGHMPSWESRLGTADRRILALYLTQLRGGDQ